MDNDVEEREVRLLQALLPNFSVELLDWVAKNPQATLKDLQVYCYSWISKLNYLESLTVGKRSNIHNP